MSGFFDDEKIRSLLTAYPVKALSIMYQTFYESLYSVARWWTKDPIAADDILQDTFIHVWENRRALAKNHHRSLENYLVRVVKLKSITYFKKVHVENQRKILFLKGQELEVDEHSIEDKIVRDELVTEIRKIIESFPTRERQCLLLKIDAGLSNVEIAERLEVTVKAVENRLTSANKRLLRRWLQRS